MNKAHIIMCAAACAIAPAAAQTTATSPDGRLAVEVQCDVRGTPIYSVTYDGHTVVAPSTLGLRSSDADYTTGLTSGTPAIEHYRKHYTQDRIKQSDVKFEATRMVCPLSDAEGKHVMDIEFMVADNDVAFRYVLPRSGERASVRVMEENTCFDFPAGTTTFLTPQSDAMTGWKRTKPSYEEEYTLDAPLDARSKYGHGYTFPALFRIPESGTWILVSETGVDSRYCGSRLSDYATGGYKIEFPMAEENNGNGTPEPAFALPGATPWRTITVGTSLAPIVETTIPWNLVEPLYEPGADFRPGRGTWSWILWQDDSINDSDLRQYVDLAASMGYEYTLVDNWWDTNLGRDGIQQLLAYARSKGVEPILWYSSSGYWNDIVQGPTCLMDNPIVRKKEMKWLHDNGVKAIKVDFFGGDKQETMRLYEAILSDANDAGIMVIFHGCTIPRGWERMYPNYIGSEAVLASENMIFSQHFCDAEAVNAATHPFIRNAAGSMEFGGTFLNRRMHRSNAEGNFRRTGDAFELATAVLFQNPAQNFALAPNNLEDAPAACLDFMKAVPTTWDETRFIDGYPGRYAVLARRHGNDWYVAGINATGEPLKLASLKLPKLAGRDIELITDTYTRDKARAMRRLKKGQE
ncbi:MAG: glycoside hydrolase family 97 protein, partial [Muribaculaceae bacterium]|nr:glycoside hydrolase family 97 protein [Muribaculaceae bacterium]